jgi:flagellar basal body rod protein FlgC
MDSLKSMLVAVSTLRGQAQRMRDVADDLALRLAGLQQEPGYDAPIPLFDADLGYDFREVYMPSHPAANERGYVRAEDFAQQAPGEASDTQLAYEAQLEAVKEALEAELPEAGNELPEDDAEELMALYA